MKNAVYQLIDNFTLFYYSFLKNGCTDEEFWSHQLNNPSINTWLGLSFERVCFRHEKQIKIKLGISGIQTEISSWYCKKDNEKGLLGSQTDLLIVRKDQVINLCEMKYSGAQYTLSKEDDEKMRNRINDLRIASEGRYAIYPTLITTYGVLDNKYSGEIQAAVVMDDLFKGV